MCDQRGLSWNYIETFDGMSLPSTLEQLWLGGNMFESLAGVEFPSSLTLLYVHNLPLSTIMGASFPNAIKNLYVSEVPSRTHAVSLASNEISFAWLGPKEPAELRAHIARGRDVP